MEANMGIRTVALVAHDHRKAALVAWLRKNRAAFVDKVLVTTGTTGRLVEQQVGLNTLPLQSGPLGGDQQIGAMIAEGKIDLLIFFWDPLAPMPHDPDIKALLRLATLWNIPMACNESTADLMVQAGCWNSYARSVPDFSEYKSRITPLDAR